MNSEQVPGRPGSGLVPMPQPGGPARAASLDRALDQTLARLDGLDAVSVHEHVEVYTAVDRALRERLAATEG